MRKRNFFNNFLYFIINRCYNLNGSIMQKKTEPRDYNNYDYLDAAVKKNRINELAAHYAALGWVCVDSRDDKIYKDFKCVVMRRPHCVAHKDELQLLQVYLESAWNRIGRAEANPCPKTLAAGLVFGVISLTAMVLGLLCGLSVLHFINSFWGYILFGAGAVLAVINAVICAKAYRRELLKTREEAVEAARIIERVHLDAAALTDNACADGAVTEGEHAR